VHRMLTPTELRVHRRELDVMRQGGRPYATDEMSSSLRL